MGFDYRTSTGLKQTVGGHKQNLVCTRTQERGEVTPEEIDPDLPVSVQESLVKPWVGGVLLQVSSSACMGTFERSHHYLHYLHHSLASGQKAGRAHRPTHQQKIGLKIY